MKCESRRSPAIDVFSAESGWTVVMDLPGCSKEDIALTFHAGKLTVEAKPRRPDMPDNVAVQRREAATAPFARTVVLSPELDADKASARVDKGVLVVNVPKRTYEAKETKINIS